VTVGRRGASVALAAGVAALVAATVVACRSQPEPNVGTPAVEALASSPAPAPSAPSAPASSSRPPVVPPAALAIPAIDVRATVDPVGVDGNGDFAVPPSVDEVGWYKFGPGANATSGSTVIAGHVDSREQGEGAFYRLRELDRGDEVTLTGDDGAVRTYRVVAREEYRKTKIPLERYFARDGAPRLTLITCGGPFDRETRRYRDNIVVTAVPA
jgi:LPXTG-site transpeptidase (sortase) family protein